MANVELHEWQKPATSPKSYHMVEATRGREFIVRMMTGADPLLALAEFAKENHVRFGKVHACFMGGFQPCKYDKWTIDTVNPENWYCEREAVCANLTMVSAVGGMIGVRPDGKGGEESFVAMHFVAGGAWDAPTIAGHLNPGTLVKGSLQVYVTEILDIDVQYPADMKEGDPYPENFYVSTTGKPGK